MGHYVFGSESLEESEFSHESLKTRTREEEFQEIRKQNVVEYLLYSSERKGASSTA